jgi:hypothetical protein
MRTAALLCLIPETASRRLIQNPRAHLPADHLAISIQQSAFSNQHSAISIQPDQFSREGRSAGGIIPMFGAPE